jgi:hypothetical protein
VGRGLSADQFAKLQAPPVYVSEVPVWKATYRIVLGAKAKP